jgi:hypothetical protein
MIVSRTPAAKVTDAALHSPNVNDGSDCAESVPNEADHFLQNQYDPIVYDEYCDDSSTDDHITERQPPSLSSSNRTVHQSQSRNSEFGRVKLFAPWFPQVDPDYNKSSGTWSWRTWHSKRHVLLWTAFTGATAVLLINVVLLSVLSKKYGMSSTRGLVSFYQGDCSRIKMLGTGFHVGINVLSTLLLGASNLCMQLLVAPTRQEIDVAHRKKIWFDIGIPSWRNLKSIKPSRVYLFYVLMASSLPLHFM